MRFDIDKRSRPILKWAGGKSGVLDQILPHFPPHKRYLEPFLGSGAVFLSLTDPTTPAILNDSNEELIHLYEVVRDNPEELMAILDKFAAEYSEVFYYELRSKVADDKITRAARTLFLNKCGFNGLYRLNSKGLFNVPYGKRVTCPTLYDRENLLAVSGRLKHAALLNEDFAAIFDMAEEGDFIYCDPPYEPLSTTSSFVSYTKGGFSRDDQARLKEAARRASLRGAKVAISNSSSPFISDLYQDWNCVQVSARRSINSKGNKRGEIAELLVLST